MLLLAAAALGCTLDRGFEQRRLADSSGVHWVYAYSGAASRSAQAATWPTADCQHHLEQSPIDVQTRTAVAAPELNDALEPHIKQHVPLLFNSGHYFELDMTAPEHTVHLDGEASAHVGGADKGWSKILNSRYRFYQVHWHSPSENMIDGKQFAMEAHYVHQLDDPRLVGSNERLGVIALMYELSDVCNPDLEQFWARLPMTPGDAAFSEVVDAGSWLAPLLSGGYYSWNGSLTTPPCTEGVSWNLLKRPSFVCQAQLDRMVASLKGMQDGVGVNNRVVQPLNARVLKASTAAPSSARDTLAASTLGRGSSSSSGSSGGGGGSRSNGLLLAVSHRVRRTPMLASALALAVAGLLARSSWRSRGPRVSTGAAAGPHDHGAIGGAGSEGDESARPLCLA
jgi:carbonic anhydrase